MQDYVGYRTKKRLEQKKKKRKLWKLLVVLAVLVGVFVVLGAVIEVSPVDDWWDKTTDGLVWVGRRIKSVWPWQSDGGEAPTAFLPEGKKTANFLVAITKRFDDVTQLNTVVVASYDSVSEKGSLIYIPHDLLVNVPGVGQDQLANLIDLDEGRISMALVTVENILGVEMDRYFLGSDRDLRIILNQVSDKYRVDVPGEMSIEDTSLDMSVDLQPGEQNISANNLAAYLTYSQEGKVPEQSERQMDFAVEFLEKSRSKQGEIEKITKKDTNLLDTDASNKEWAGVWEAFSLLKNADLQQGIIPIKEFRFENTVVDTLDNEKLPQFIEKYVKQGEDASSSQRYRVEILNGCGVPAVGKQVAASIELDEFEVVDSSGNADNFDYAETLIIIYGAEEGLNEAANEIRNELEVGRVEIRPVTTEFTDITIIVGKDYASK